MKGEALIAMNMIMGAEIFIAAMADQERAGDQLEGSAAAAIAEAALPHIGEGEALMQLRIRRIARRGRAAKIEDRERLMLQERRDGHCKVFPRFHRAADRLWGDAPGAGKPCSVRG